MKSFLKKIHPLLFLGLVCSCGQGTEKAKAEKTENKLQSSWGSYLGKLVAVNPSETPRLRGSLTLVYKDDLTASMRLAGGSPSSLSLQGIHEGRCPVMEDDLNRDGFIDGEEGALAFRGMLIPLDDDLHSQHMGWGIFPTTDSFGEYIWSRVSSMNDLLQDLNEEDLNLQDELIKLGNKDLELEGKVVVVRGLTTTVSLPDSVAGSGHLSPHASFPIACGKLFKTSKVPGRIEKEGESSFPYGSEYEGHGNDDEANFPSGDEGGINYGN